MIKAFEIWKRGLLILLIVFMIAAIAPLGIVLILSMLFIIPMYIFGFSLDFWDENLQDLAVFAIIIFGPYFLAEKWDEIMDSVPGLKPKQED